MAWQPQASLKKSKKPEKPKAPPIPDFTDDEDSEEKEESSKDSEDDRSRYRRLYPNPKKSKNAEIHSAKFLEDWERCRDRHPGQIVVLGAVFDERAKYVFYRAGRKGAKTTTAIDVAWRIANESPNRVIYLCYPTIAQGIEVVWEERRLQTCDQKDDYMFDRYVEKIDETRHIVKFTNGSFVKLIGTWSEARGRGTQPDFLIYDEFQDCSPEYIEAMDPNLAAKENAQCVIMGTPPKKRNQYEEWWDRISNNPQGRVFHYTSYDNIKLPHLKQWLDDKHKELVKAGREDVWLREYMAEFCYSSSDRVLPDIEFQESSDIENFMKYFNYEDRIPFLALSIHKNYFCAILGIIVLKKTIFVYDHLIMNQIWNRSFSDLSPELNEKCKYIQNMGHKKLRKIVWDESDSFTDVIQGFTKCRKDLKWQDRGIPLLRELLVKDKIKISNQVADIGMESQNLLIDESVKDVQKAYPHICTLSMLVNEYFSPEKLDIRKDHAFDKWDAFREMGIPVPPPKKDKKFMIFGRDY